ncbi:MAG: acyl-CoA dehydrogenase family protein, partial [Nocardioidaceae bacterium]
MAVDRMMPDPESEQLLGLVREIAAEQLAPRASLAEANAEFPRDVFRVLGHAGLLSLPFDESQGGGGQPYEVYLQVLEELAAAWMSVGVDVSVHTLSAYALATFGDVGQQQRWLGDMLGGEMLGAYALSEPQAGSDVSAISTKAVRAGGEYVITGTKAWISHGPHADFLLLFARTASDPRNGLSAFYVPAGTEGMSFGAPEKKMGMNASTTTQIIFDQARVPADRRVGAEGDGMKIALSALDSGRLGIAACATGLAQAALDLAVGYARERQQFGRRIAEFQG